MQQHRSYNAMNRRKPRRKRKYRLKPQVKIVLGVLIAAAITVPLMFLLKPKRQQMAESASLPFNIETEAVIVRDESAYYCDFDFSQISFSADEGEDVNKDDKIAVAYKLGYTEDVAQRLYDVQEQIYIMQTELIRGINEHEISAAEDRIAALEAELQNRAADSRGLREIENDLADAIEERNLILRNKVQPTEELSALYTEEASRKKQFEEWSKQIAAGKSGRFSCYMDGLEQTLCMDKLNTVTVSQLKRALKSDGYSTARSSDNFMYRIVNPNKFCIAFLIDENSMPCLYEGESYTVKFRGIEEQYIGKCATVKTGGKNKLCIIEFNKDVGELITMRTAYATITGAFSGAKVNLDAINTKNGEFFVKFVTGGEKTEKIAVEVLAIDNEYAIIRAKDGGRELIGLWYSTRKG